MSGHMRSIMLTVALFAAVPLAAQQTAPAASRPLAPALVSAPAPAVHPAPAPGPMLEPSAVGFHARTTQPAPAPMAMPVNGENSQNVALMVVGGAGLIVGAVIGGRSGMIVMLGSGVIGLVGLFRYMQ